MRLAFRNSIIEVINLRIPALDIQPVPLTSSKVCRGDIGNLIRYLEASKATAEIKPSRRLSLKGRAREPWRGFKLHSMKVHLL